jgi:hypothetical protein
MEQTMTTERAALWRGWRVAAGLLAMLALLALGLWNLAGPRVWWDEGWTLSVARTWVERGFYGRLLDGQLATSGLQAAFPVTGSVALSFQLFGVGVWQGRLPGIVAMVGSFALMYILAERLYNQRVAIGTLCVMLLIAVYPDLHPLLIGRQVLGEIYMIFFLLAGYIGLLLALRRSTWWVVPAAIFWGLALATKAQALPFWTVSLIVPLMAALFQRQWREAGLLGVGLIGAFAVYKYGLPIVERWIVWDRQASTNSLSLGAVEGLYAVTAFVPNIFNRWAAVQIVLIAGLPSLCGLCYGLWRMIQAFRQRESRSVDAGGDAVRLSLLAFAGSWLAWYTLLSVGWVRYLFPATFLSSIFVSAWLFDLTDQFAFASTLNRISAALRTRRFDRRVGVTLLAVELLAVTVPMTLQTLYRDYITADDHSAQAVADFLNTQTRPDARVETYESELHFLLNRPYHYPPDQTHVELNHRSFLGENVVIDYDPLVNDPDYLVVGPFGRMWRLYDPVLATKSFRLLRQAGLYDVYERIR